MTGPLASGCGRSKRFQGLLRQLAVLLAGLKQTVCQNSGQEGRAGLGADDGLTESPQRLFPSCRPTFG